MSKKINPIQQNIANAIYGALEHVAKEEIRYDFDTQYGYQLLFKMLDSVNESVKGINVETLAKLATMSEKEAEVYYQEAGIEGKRMESVNAVRSSIRNAPFYKHLVQAGLDNEMIQDVLVTASNKYLSDDNNRSKEYVSKVFGPVFYNSLFQEAYNRADLNKRLAEHKAQDIAPEQLMASLEESRKKLKESMKRFEELTKDMGAVPDKIVEQAEKKAVEFDAAMNKVLNEVKQVEKQTQILANKGQHNNVSVKEDLLVGKGLSEGKGMD